MAGRACTGKPGPWEWLLPPPQVGVPGAVAGPHLRPVYNHSLASSPAALSCGFPAWDVGPVRGPLSRRADGGGRTRRALGGRDPGTCSPVAVSLMPPDPGMWLRGCGITEAVGCEAWWPDPEESGFESRSCPPMRLGLPGSGGGAQGYFPVCRAGAPGLHTRCEPDGHEGGPPSAPRPQRPHEAPRRVRPSALRRRACPGGLRSGPQWGPGWGDGSRG